MNQSGIVMLLGMLFYGLIHRAAPIQTGGQREVTHIMEYKLIRLGCQHLLPSDGVQVSQGLLVDDECSGGI
ncbi:hypothetical protein EYF80_053926 [Liparis tanakae]|uniref:Uncharacterized protein n=1 Tax=Liparis tanakae TaxID=230148 RepID=A0A4Z2F3U6_9TELE|nr:hypothetical protein EYF80_053926 [Liparis tanakae]